VTNALGFMRECRNSERRPPACIVRAGTLPPYPAPVFVRYLPGVTR
jgi:hypothetical protein